MLLDPPDFCHTVLGRSHSFLKTNLRYFSDCKTVGASSPVGIEFPILFEISCVENPLCDIKTEMPTISDINNTEAYITLIE